MKIPDLAFGIGALLAASLTMAAAGPVAVDAAATRFKIGDLDAVSLRDASFAAPNDGSIFGTDASPEEVGKVLKAAGAPSDVVNLSVSAMLVKDGKRLVLIDSGLGTKVGGVLIQSLAKAGVAPGEVTDVLITHEHGDHVGGLVTADGRSAFPKAAIRLSAPEWAHIQSQADLAPLAKVIAPQVKTFEPGAVILPGITAVPIKGHTPGHTGYEIVSGHDRLIDIGDAAHSSIVSLTKPEWAMGFDSDKALAKESRKSLLASLSASHEKIFSPHFPYPGVGTVKADGDHYSWQPSLQPALAGQ
jgi:glyoxylase-like metal-dependent hydrolase (beta-lactamase superfamily II)